MNWKLCSTRASVPNMKLPFLVQLKAAGLPLPTEEYRFDDARKWRFDYAWVGRGLAVEIEGGTRSVPGGGRHQRHKGYSEDCRKYNAAQLKGWRVLRFTSEMIASGEALQVLETVFKGENREPTRTRTRGA